MAGQHATSTESGHVKVDSVMPCRKSRSRIYTGLQLSMTVGVIIISAVVIIRLAISPSSVTGKLQSGRIVKANSDSFFMSSRYAGNIAVIEIGRTTFTVEPGKLLLNNQCVAVIPQSTMLVEIEVYNSQIAVAADGKNILPMPR